MKRRRKGTAVAPPVTEPWLREAQRSGMLDWLGAYGQQVPMLKSTTRQTSALHLAVAAAPTSAHGLYAGEDLMTGWPVFHDPIEGYRLKTVLSPNVACIGDVGGGKSSFSKTWVVLRNLMLGRRVVVVDKKMQFAGEEDGVHEGEYSPLARLLGVQPVRFTGKSGGVRINPMDPVITGHGGLAADDLELLKAILLEVIGRPLTPDESKALRVARTAAVDQAKHEGRPATILDINRYLLEPDEEFINSLPGSWSAREYADWGRHIGFALEECVEGDLAGLIDGETSKEITLTGGLTVFDISALPDNGPAVPVVMAIINTWLRSTLLAQRTAVPTYFVIEEGWHLVEGSFATISQQNTKKSRGLSLSTVTNYQHLSDVPEKSPAIATIKEAGTVAIFRQVRTDDAVQCQELFGLPKSATELIKNLAPGCCLLKIGNSPAVLMRAHRSRTEAAIADTDGALLSRARVALEGQSVPGAEAGELALAGGELT